MQKHAFLVMLILSLFLSGCGKEKEVVAKQDLYPIMSQTVWDDITITAITPVCSFISDADSLKIFPYNNKDVYISVKKVVISDNSFWKTVEAEYKSTANIKKGDGYSLITNKEHVTYGYVLINKEYAYVTSAAKLPSSYVQEVCKVICKSST